MNWLKAITALVSAVGTLIGVVKKTPKAPPCPKH
jgi:hypothetical protein